MGKLLKYIAENLKIKEDNTQEKIDLLLNLRNYAYMSGEERQMLLEIVEMLEGK